MPEADIRVANVPGVEFIEWSGEVLDALIDDHVRQRRDNGPKLLSLYSLARWLDAWRW